MANEFVNKDQLRRMAGKKGKNWVDSKVKTDPTFPRPRHIDRNVFFLASEAVAWLQEKTGVIIEIPPRDGEYAIPSQPADQPAVATLSDADRQAIASLTERIDKLLTVFSLVAISLSEPTNSTLPDEKPRMGRPVGGLNRRRNRR
jgi:predicted DNA-binding transcriptional regulator AlpA